jgi:hypothetical protein
MNCRQPPHTVLFAPDALRSAWPKHDRGLHGPGWGTACARPHKVCDFSFPWPVKSPWPVESVPYSSRLPLLHRAASPGCFSNFSF